MRQARPTLWTGLTLGVAAGISWQRRRYGRRETFNDKTIVITGGARGFGLALARRFAAEGAELVLIARTGAELERARHELDARGARVSIYEADVRDPTRVEELVKEIVAAHRHLDVIINNAGVIQMMPFDHATIEDFQDSLAIHFWAPLYLTMAARPHLRETRGRIVNISSIGGRVAVPHLLPYCVGKFALSALSDGLHAELGPEGISVTTVAPGLMRTGSHRNVKVRGHHASEARLFALSTSTSLTSMSVDRAAARVVEAVRERRARITVGVQARTAEVVNTLLPDLSAAISRVVTAVLPGPAGQPAADLAKWSRDLDLGWIARLFPSKAAEKMNQPIALDEVH